MAGSRFAPDERPRSRSYCQEAHTQPIAGWIAWLAMVPVFYQVMHQVLAGFQAALTRQWRTGVVSISLKDLCLCLLVLAVATLLGQGMRFFLNEEVFPRTSVRLGVSQATSRLAQYGVVLIGFFLATAAAGVDLSRFTLITGAVGVGLGFGLQNLVSNFVSGIIISLERPLRVGDTVEVAHQRGKVTAIGFRSSTIRSTDGAGIIVPNSELIGKSFVNWSLTDQLQQGKLRVAVAYGTDPVRVLELLRDTVQSHPAVLKTPSPGINFDRFGEIGLEFLVCFWTGIDRVDNVRSDLNVLIAEELAKNGILAPPLDPKVSAADLRAAALRAPANLR